MTEAHVNNNTENPFQPEVVLTPAYQQVIIKSQIKACEDLIELFQKIENVEAEISKKTSELNLFEKNKKEENAARLKKANEQLQVAQKELSDAITNKQL